MVSSGAHGKALGFIPDLLRDVRGFQAQSKVLLLTFQEDKSGCCQDSGLENQEKQRKESQAPPEGEGRVLPAGSSAVLWQQGEVGGFEINIKELAETLVVEDNKG